LVLTVCVIQLPAYARDGHKKPREGAMPRPIWGGTIKRIRNRTVSFCLASLILTISPAWGGDKEKDEETLRNAAQVLKEMLKSDSVPSGVLAKADCVIVLPDVKKVGFGIGGSGGRGPMLCRSGGKFEGPWSAPAMYTIGGASFGLQIGGSSTDFVLLLMDARAVDAVLNGKTKLGRDATAAAGPSGATSNGTVGGSDILTYGRASGLFAGMSLGGATLDPDDDANTRLYGKSITAQEIVRGSAVQSPAGGTPLVSLLNAKVVNHND
jgi:lipid-binding SYLF domain-containing protein